MAVAGTRSLVGPAPLTYLGPPFQQARVHDAMRIGLVTCRPETPLRDVARMMASYGVHAILVADLGDPGGDRPWGVVSDLDIVSAAGSDLDARTARDLASTELVTIGADETLERAARLMAEHEVHHLVALQPDTGRPVGVVSTLGVAGALAGR